MKRILLLCLSLGMFLAPKVASAAKPDAKLAQELDKAHSIYVMPDTADDAFNDFIVSYVHAWGRYDNMPTAQGADLILRYNVDLRRFTVYLILNVYDGNTLEKVAAVKSTLPSIFWSQSDLPKSLAKSLDALAKLAGPAEPRPSKTMKTSPPQKFKIGGGQNRILEGLLETYTQTEPVPDVLKTAHRVIVMDGHTPLQYPYPAGRAARLLQNDLHASTRFQLVSSIHQADIVLDIGGRQTWEHDDHDPRSSPNDPDVDIVLLDPKTLQGLWRITAATPVTGTLGMVLHPDRLSTPSAKKDKLPSTVQSMLEDLQSQSTPQP